MEKINFYKFWKFLDEFCKTIKASFIINLILLKHFGYKMFRVIKFKKPLAVLLREAGAGKRAKLESDGMRE